MTGTWPNDLTADISAGTLWGILERGKSLTDPKYGADPLGVADSTTAISDWLDDCNEAGTYGVIPGGMFSCNPISKTYSPKILAPGGATILARTPQFGFLWSFTGSTGASRSISTMTVGTQVVTVSTTGLAVGGLVVVGHLVSSDPTAGNGHRWQGQQAEIASIDSSTQLTLIDAAIFTYNTTPVLIPVASIDQPIVKGLRFDCPNLGTAPQGFLDLSFANDVDIDIEMTRGGYTGLRLRSVYGGRATINCRDFHYDASNGQFAYAVSTVMASAHLRLNVFDRNGAVASAVDAENDQYGEPVDLQISGVAHDCAVGPWNTHPFGYDIRFVNCFTRNVGNSGEDAGYDHAIDARCRKVQILGGSAWNVTNGSGVGQGGVNDELTIEGYDVKGAQYGLKADQNMTKLRIRNVIWEDLQQMPIRSAGTIGDFSWSAFENVNWGINDVSGETYGSRFFGAITKGRIHHGVWRDPGTHAANEATQGVTSTDVKVFFCGTLGLSGSAPFPVVSGWTYPTATNYDA